MIGVAEAQARVLALGTPVDVERRALADAVGCWAAEDVYARRSQPAADLSSMDGYAVRHADLPGPWRLVGESAAGSPYVERCRPGEAIRISTGATVPLGADTVLIQEEVVQQGDTISWTASSTLKEGSWIRSKGSDFGRGAMLLAQGTTITASRAALAAMGGYDTLATRRAVRVAIASTGNELVVPGSDPEGGLPDANSPMLAAMLETLPARAQIAGIVSDQRDDLAELFAGSRDMDILVTTGGASVGDHDLVRPALLAAGGAIDFWRIAMRPGKPLLAGTLGSTVVLGLPGNPVSAFVTATLFLLPLVRHLAGAHDPLPRTIFAELGEPLPEVGARTDYLRARWADGCLTPLPSYDSGALVPLAAADAFIVRAAGSPPALAGARVAAILLT